MPVTLLYQLCNTCCWFLGPVLQCIAALAALLRSGCEPRYCALLASHAGPHTLIVLAGCALYQGQLGEFLQVQAWPSRGAAETCSGEMPVSSVAGVV